MEIDVLTAVGILGMTFFPNIQQAICINCFGTEFLNSYEVVLIVNTNINSSC